MLTALELHQELLENTGKSLPILRAQFDADAPPSSPVKSSVSSARISELEHELQEARNKIGDLQRELASKEKERVKAAEPQRTEEEASRIEDLEKESIRNTELRAINYLIMKYLRDQGYKLSAITLEEEVKYSVALIECFFRCQIRTSPIGVK